MSAIPAWRCEYGGTTVAACRRERGHGGDHPRRHCAACHRTVVEGSPPACRACGALYDEAADAPKDTRTMDLFGAATLGRAVGERLVADALAGTLFDQDDECDGADR